MLQFDWEDVDGQPILGIVGRSSNPLDDGVMRWTAIAFIMGDQAVIITVDSDTDELCVGLDAPPTGDTWAPIEQLADNLGKELGWCWIGRNYRGYLDSFTVAFSGIDPECTFIGLGTTIVIKRLVAVGRM